MAQHFAAEAGVETGAMKDKTEIPTASDLSSSASRLAELRKHLRPYWAGPKPAEFSFWRDCIGRTTSASSMRWLREYRSWRRSSRRSSQLARILADDVLAFLEVGKLAPGPYQLDNYHLDYAENENLTFNGDGDPPIALPAERIFTFTVTD
jgi:hypothetical protein